MSEAIIGLRDRGNTVLMVEHHREVMEIADHIIDMESGAGTLGGEILFTGSYTALRESDTLTRKLLRQRNELKQSVRTAKDRFSLRHLNLHNLNDVSVKLPKGLFTVIAGVTSSGKNSLMQAFTDQADEEVISKRRSTLVNCPFSSYPIGRNTFSVLRLFFFYFD